MDTMYFSSAETAMNAICQEAARAGASDIHIEPEADSVRVRLRKDGLLYEYARLQPHLADKLAVRSKVMGRMNMAENRVPQDGGALFSHGGVSYDLRISTLPSLYGETIVIRLLTPHLPFIENRTLGMLPVQDAAFTAALRAQSGLILTTGPTGSGKTSTLYAALAMVNRPEVNIISIEDPVEYKIPGITQTAVNEKAGLTFAAGLRALVRQDPDILMIGEIRDQETAEIAVHAALTGHLVLSTLHTRSAAEAPLRLMDMGIPSYLIAASLSLIISQRLLPLLCPHCKEKIPGGGGRCRPTGCPRCEGRGFSGRTGIFELLPITKKEETAIREKAPPAALQSLMKEQGQPTLAMAAREVAEMGMIGNVGAL